MTVVSFGYNLVNPSYFTSLSACEKVIRDNNKLGELKSQNSKK